MKDCKLVILLGIFVTIIILCCSTDKFINGGYPPWGQRMPISYDPNMIGSEIIAL